MKINALLLLVLICHLSYAAKTKVVFLNVDPRTQSVEVVLDSPPQGDYLDGSKYHLVGINSALPNGELHWIALSDVQISPTGKIVVLIPQNPAEIKATKQLMLFVASEPAVTQSKYEKNPAKPTEKPSKANSDIYLNGTYSPAINGAAQYSIDTSVGLLFPLAPSSETNYGSVGFLGTVKSDKRPTANPDSYRFFGVYQRVLNKEPHWPLEGVLFIGLIAGAEFDRKANNVNFISSPILDFPIRLRGEIHNKGSLVPVLTPELGMEIGNNFTNAINANGQGFIARGLAGGTLGIDFKSKLAFFKSVHLASTYRVRIPAFAEVYTRTATNAAGKTIDVPGLSTQARHYIKNELDFGLWKPLSFAITHEYGTLPPAFRLVDQKVSIGFTLALQPKGDLQGQLTGK
ncbi:MAG TPA: hypothetical protein VGD64_01995 [Acidisarcina sp.]